MMILENEFDGNIPIVDSLSESIIDWVFGGEKSIRVCSLLITILIFIITPWTYILNRETTKQIIVLESWFKGIRAIFMGTSEAQSEVDRIQRERRNASINNISVDN